MVAFCLKSAFGSGHAGIHDSIHRKHKEPFLLSGNKEQKIMNKAGQFRVMVLGMWIQIISVGVLASTSYAGTKEVMSAGMIPGSAVTDTSAGMPYFDMSPASSWGSPGTATWWPDMGGTSS
jgi:hypothetical protein